MFRCLSQNNIVKILLKVNVICNRIYKINSSDMYHFNFISILDLYEASGNVTLLYTGFAGGSWYGDQGAAVDPLCLPRDPEWGIYKDGRDGDKAYVYGAEYQTFSYNVPPGVHDHDVPCAVCLVRKRSVTKMFAGNTNLFK